MHADNGEGETGDAEKPFVLEGGEYIESTDDPGFIAYDRHLDKLRMLLTTWVGIIDRDLNDRDELVADEIRHQIKKMLTDTTHDIFLKVMSVNAMGVEEEE